MGWTLEAESAGLTSSTGEKSSNCRMRPFSALSGTAKRGQVCQPLVRSAARKFRRSFATCAACKVRRRQHNCLAIPNVAKLFIGSDLSSYAGARSADDIRSAITDPDKNLDPRKRPVTVTTLDGKKQTGMARNEDNFSLQIQALDGSFHFFAKSELRNIEYQARSLMPDDYGSSLSRQELDDLVSYLMSIARANILGTGNKPQGREDEVKE